MVTKPNGTVKIHSDLIIKNTYVWWGWWHKSGEKVLFNVFSELLQKIKTSKDLTIYLFDAGHSIIYKAKCIDIKYDNSGSAISVPEADKAPDYYNQTDYLAWFKFSSIEKVDFEELKKNSYIEIEEFFTDKKYNFSLFNNKKIISTDELKLQERTIWFVRDARDTELEPLTSALLVLRSTPDLSIMSAAL